LFLFNFVLAQKELLIVKNKEDGQFREIDKKKYPGWYQLEDVLHIPGKYPMSDIRIISPNREVFRIDVAETDFDRYRKRVSPGAFNSKMRLEAKKFIERYQLETKIVEEKVIKPKFSESILALLDADRNNWRYIADCKMEQGIRIDDILTNDCAVVRRGNDDKTLEVYVTDQDRLNPKQFDQRLADAIKKFEEGEREQHRQAMEKNKSIWDRLLGR